MIAIKDMEEMPSRCLWDCPLAREDGGACQLADVRTSDKERPKDCPLTEIVTCKDCANHVTGALDEEICLKGHELIHENFYCKDGERKE